MKACAWKGTAGRDPILNQALANQGAKHGRAAIFGLGLDTRTTWESPKTGGIALDATKSSHRPGKGRQSTQIAPMGLPAQFVASLA